MKQETLDGLKRYAEHGIPTDGFLQAVLENNLMESFGRADEKNQDDLFEICSYIYNEMPAACHGSPEKVQIWIENKMNERKVSHESAGKENI